MKDLDIVFVSNALGNGGAARVLCLLANHWSHEGYKVGVLVFGKLSLEYQLDSSIALEYAPLRVGPLSKVNRLRWLRRRVSANPAASVVAFEYFVNISTLIACWGLPNRVIVSERNDPARVGSGFPRDPLRKLLYRKADALVCQTTEASDYFSDRINKCVILNPVQPGLPRRTDTPRRRAVVYFGRLEEQKNLQMLIRAFAKVHEYDRRCSLEIYGDGSGRDSLESLVTSLALDSCVHIRPARGDIHEVVKDCALFVLPSNYEGLSNSMIEAMALGLPTICTDSPSGGARMLIDDGENGLLVPVGEEHELSTAMLSILSNSTLAAKLSSNAEKIRDRLSLQVVAQEWERVIFGSRVR